MSNNVLFNVDQYNIATITLNRAELHNAFDDVLIQELLKILQTIHNDPKIRVVVLAAAGKSFSAGADLNWMRRMAAYSYEENIRDALALSNLMHALKFLNKPTIARVQGAAFGGGVGLVACCDMAIVSNKASFCLSEVKIGLIPAVISPYVISAMGERAARRYFLTAEAISAADALRLGLATEVVAEAELDSAVQKIINCLLLNSPQAVCAAKELINRVSADPYQQDHQQKNAEAIAAIRVSKEGQEGLSAFLEKRKPAWHSQ
jgi:methylglutaconyl-CoA hydratase